MNRPTASHDGIATPFRVEHLAIWSRDLERLKAFYQTHFHAAASARYEHPAKGFASYFLTFGEGCRLEIMQRSPLAARPGADALPLEGLAHFALAVADEAQVRACTESLRAAGVTIAGEPRRTGDGYYESVVVDPDGNLVEIVAR